MTTTRNYDEEIDRFIGGDASVKDLKLVVRYGEGGNYNLAQTFFRFLGEQEALTHLDSLSIEIPSHRSQASELMEMLRVALRDTKLRTIRTLKVQVPHCDGEEVVHGLVLSFRDGCPLQVENLDLRDFNFGDERTIEFLALFLVHNKSSLKHLSLGSIEGVSSEGTACLGACLSQLSNLVSLEVFANFLDQDDDASPFVLLFTKFAEIISLEKLTIDIADHMQIVDCIGSVVLPSLTRLKHFVVGTGWTDQDLASPAVVLGRAIQAHPSINSLHLDWWTIPAFDGIIPALPKCRHLKLYLLSYARGLDEPPKNERPKNQPTVSEVLRNNRASFANLETFDLQFRTNDDTLLELAESLGAACPRLEKLTLSDYDWSDRKDDSPFPQPSEKEALVQFARTCPSLYYLKVRPPETEYRFRISIDKTENYELAKQVRKIRLGVEDIAEDRIPANFPALLAKSWKKTENDQDVLVNLDVVFELFQEKAGIFFQM